MTKTLSERQVKDMHRLFKGYWCIQDKAGGAGELGKIQYLIGLRSFCISEGEREPF